MRHWAAIGTILFPGAAFACALPPSVVLTLPTGVYIWGAAGIVAVTALLGARPDLLPLFRTCQVGSWRASVASGIGSYLAFAGFVVLLAVGFVGPRDPMHNLMTLVFWTGVWVALPLASLLLGNLWAVLNPWTAPVRIARTLLNRRGGIGLARLGHWPAVAGLAGFSWFQMISLYPDDPVVLARLAAIYWTVIFALAVAEGEDWLTRGEFLTVFFGFVAKIAPFWTETAVPAGRVRLMAGWPGTQVLGMAPLTASATAFVTLALAALTFDGLRETFWWLGVIGQNPLEFTGRSAVRGVNTLGLLAVWALTAAVLPVAVALGRGLGGAGLSVGPIMLSFLAIAAGYHAAHYLVTLLTAGQYTLAALNDPLFRGDALLGLQPFYVSFGFLTDPRGAAVVYAVQFAAILSAHVLAVVLALHLGRQARALAHLPLTGVMVGYTVLGLWLLSTAKGA